MPKIRVQSITVNETGLVTFHGVDRDLTVQGDRIDPETIDLSESNVRRVTAFGSRPVLRMRYRVNGGPSTAILELDDLQVPCFDAERRQVPVGNQPRPMGQQLFTVAPGSQFTLMG